jgi:dTDP-4-amino-4,6-dideoxygalactose transaminase
LTDIPFIDLRAQRLRIGDRVDKAVLKVVHHGAYVMGPEVLECEKQLGAFCGAKHVLSCSSGTDALALILMAWGIGRGDAVFVPAFTFAATAEVVAWLGAVPIFVDVDENDFCMSASSLEEAIETAKRLNLAPRVVIPVDLFGQPADYKPLLEICRRNQLRVLCDAAQSFGARYGSENVGVIGDATATSFFPAKPLGCYGDGGAVFVDDDALIEVLRSLRIHGQGTNKYENVRIGLNGRMDTIQAAVLLEKLAIFADEIAQRQMIADRYNDALAGIVAIPRLAEERTSVWAQYTIRVEPARRDEIISTLQKLGIPTAVYYPIPLNRQEAYKDFPAGGNGVPVSERLAAEVLSLPMHPYLDAATQDRIVAGVRTAVGARTR